MRRTTYRQIGAIVGLAGGLAVMYAIGNVGLIPAFVLGGGGCVATAIIAERLYDFKA